MRCDWCGRNIRHGERAGAYHKQCLREADAESRGLPVWPRDDDEGYDNFDEIVTALEYEHGEDLDPALLREQGANPL
jgi:hypothetical protein